MSVNALADVGESYGLCAILNEQASIKSSSQKDTVQWKPDVSAMSPPGVEQSVFRKSRMARRRSDNLRPKLRCQSWQSLLPFRLTRYHCIQYLPHTHLNSLLQQVQRFQSELAIAGNTVAADTFPISTRSRQRIIIDHLIFAKPASAQHGRSA